MGRLNKINLKINFMSKTLREDFIFSAKALIRHFKNVGDRWKAAHIMNTLNSIKFDMTFSNLDK